MPDPRALTCFLVAWTAVSCSTVAESERRAKSPAALLRSILTYSEQGDHAAVARLVYPLEVVPGVSMPDCVVAGMKKSPVGYCGDFSYSDAALRVLLERHMSEFHHPSEEEARRMGLADGGSLMDEGLRALVDADPRSLLLLDQGKCRVVLLRREGTYLLVFWEGLNDLLRPADRVPRGR